MDLRLLGPVELWTEGKPIRVGPPKQRAVLAVLAYSVGQPVPVSVLIERVWCDSPPAEARTSIQAYVTRLRRLTGPEQPIDIARAGDGYQLNLPWPDVDVNRARRLAQEARSSLEAGDHGEASRLSRDAIDLWRGEPLAGVTGTWADRVRAGLVGEHLSLLAVHARALLDLDRRHDAVAVLTEAVAEHPGAEQLTGQLMVALQRCGQPVEALAAYRRLHRHLADHLGVEPGPELRRLHQALLQPKPEPGRPLPLAADAAGHVDEITEEMRGLIRCCHRQGSIADEHRARLRRSLEYCLSAAAQAARLLA
ncbi:AfsR/SARP family transcriptional regulator [Actinoplanes hulinensis]|uniref:AfsR/SARP family transcriptional regulator n=1 Tax=Actinoplanes hulinensis TaxID=1144547 RepID=A0ABS7BFS4_9ACTN|nr:AfsR/SARP family transcriptional regulator [Actinoplanes hulinensis]MBW6439731.1 AfsR/SARP family transcriptional regulator [Actinoplanes hulinensis]